MGDAMKEATFSLAQANFAAGDFRLVNGMSHFFSAGAHSVMYNMRIGIKEHTFQKVIHPTFSARSGH